MLGVLLGLAMLALLLPRAWTGRLVSLVQVLVPFQDAVSTAAGALEQGVPTGGETISAEAYSALEREKAALEHRLAALAMHAAELEKEVSVLTATRVWGGAQQLGARGQLIPARVITADMVPWRASKLINAGTLQGVQRGAAVTSASFGIDRGETAGVNNGMAVLLAEAVVGTIEAAGTHTARVKLLSDVSVEMKVRIGRFTDDGFVPVDQYFWLTGRGSGIMQIRDVDQRLVDKENGVIGQGDVVLSDPSSVMLPAPMMIGKVASIDLDRDNPVFSILTVAPAVEGAELKRVYVFDPAGDRRQ